MKRINLLKRFQTSRMLLSLALCSGALVVFSAVVYTTALAGVYAEGQGSAPLSLLAGSSEEIDPNPDPLTGSSSSNGDDILIGSGGLALASPSLLDISLTGSNGSAASKDGTGSKAGEANGSSDGKDGDSGSGSSAAASGDAQQGSGASSYVGQSGASASAPSAASAGNASTVDAAAENAYHQHIAKYYAELSDYYKHLCSGLNNAYAAMNSGSAKTVSVSPVNAGSYIGFIDKKRIEAQECTYNGVHISESSSKWYAQYENVWRMYENLVNLTSIMREIDGMGVSQARDRVAYYSNSSGKIREIADFEQRYSKVRL